jgi:hypothetical protein
MEEVKMWTSRSEKLADGRGLRYIIEVDSSPVSYAEVLHLWQSDAHFRSVFLALLASVPFSGFRWETPPLTAATADQRFEFVVLDSPGLASSPDPHAFAEHFRGATSNNEVVAFSNLACNAILVVPCPNTHSLPSAYGHLGAFVRHAPQPQQHALWQLVAETMYQRLGTAPVWLSTAGAGVSWLHVRLDDRPKYYGYGPYRQAI